MDFHYNGVDYSIPGNTQILLTQLIEIMHITVPENDEAAENGEVPENNEAPENGEASDNGALLDIHDVASVEFTDAHLVQVDQVSGLVTINGTDGQRADVDAGDYNFLLSSLEPFSTNEKLTITLKDGTVIEVGVTDDKQIVINFYDIDESTPVEADMDGFNYLAVNNGYPNIVETKLFIVNGSSARAEYTNDGTAGLALVKTGEIGTLNSQWWSGIEKVDLNDSFTVGAFAVTKQNDGTYKAVKLRAYEVEIVTADGNVATGIGSEYKIYAGVDKKNQNGQTVRYYSDKQVSMDGESSQSMSFCTFNRSNENPNSKGFESGDSVQIALVKNLIVEANNDERGTISGGTIIEDGDLMGDYTVSISKDGGKTTYTLTENEPYKINIKTSNDGNVEFDSGYNGYWYLLSTLTKSNGSKYYYVHQLASNSNTINKVTNHEITKYYNADQLSNVSIASPAGNTSVYQSGDTVENKLVYTGSTQKSTYNDIVNGEAYGNGDVVNKYTLSDETTNGVGNVVLASLPDFKVKTIFKEADDTATVASDVPSDYKLLIKMVINSKTYYALHEVSGNNPSSLSDAIKFYEYIPGENGGPASVGTTPYYYTGTETLTTQVVTGADTILEALNNGTNEGVVRYNENTVGAQNQNSDMTKDIYSSSSAITQGDDGNYTMTTTFVRRKNDGVDHDIKVSFYKAHTDNIETAVLDDAVELDGTYFFRVKLLNSGKLVGYTIMHAAEVSNADGVGWFTTTIPANHNFTLVDDKGVDIADSTLHYDPTVYTSEVRLYKLIGNSLPTNLDDVASKGDDKIPGYDFWQNVYEDKTGEIINKTMTDLALYKEQKKIYQVKVAVEDGIELTNGDKIRLNVVADHATTDDQRLDNFDITSVASTVEGGKRIYTIVIEDQVNNTQNRWTNNVNNSINGNETFTVEVTQNGEKRYEGYPITLSGSNDNFAVSYDTQVTGGNIQVDDVNKVTTITNWVYINKVNYDEAVHPDYILGDAVEFGIVANKYKQQGHTETNFAVNIFEGNGFNTDIDGSGSGDIPIYVGSIINQLWLSSASLAPIDIYIPQEFDDHDPNNGNGLENRTLRITTTLPTTIIHMSQEEIRRYVDSMIEYGQRMSLNLAELSNVRPYQVDNNDKTLDFRDFPDNTTIYVDCSDITSMISGDCGGWNILKRENQSIVFSVPGEDVRIGEFYVSTYDGNGVCKVDSLKSTTDALNGNVARNKQVDDVILQHITFNCYQAEKLDTKNASALFLAPFADYVTQDNGAGWILAEGTVDSKAEWHYYYHYRHYSSSSNGGIMLLTKVLKDKDGNPIAYVNMDFKFTMTETNESWVPLTGRGHRKTTWTTDEGTVEFTGFKYNNHDIDPSGESAGKTKSFYYVIEEVPAEGAKSDGTTFYIDGVEYSKEKVKIRVEAHDDGAGHINCTYYAINDKGVESQVDLNSANNTFSFGTVVNKIAVGKATVEGKKSFVPVGSHTITQADVDAYTFTLERVTQNAPMPTVLTKNMNSASDPTFSFGDIKFSSANLNRDANGKPIETVFEYRITESGTCEGVVNDTREHTVKITVSPDPTYHLKLNTAVKYYIGGVEKTVDEWAFENTCSVKTGALKLTKEVTLNGSSTGTQLADGEYAFTVTGPTPATETVATVVIKVVNGVATQYKLNDATSFTDLPENKYVVIPDLNEGDYVITETEVSGMTTKVSGGKESLDNSPARTITVHVTAGVDEPAAAATATFTNDKPYIEANIPGMKVLENDVLTAEQFSFTIAADSSNSSAPMPVQTTVSNAANGSFSFGPIAYKLSDLGNENSKAFKYTISEQQEDESDIVYDNQAIEVTVTVTKGNDGKLSAVVDKDANAVKFTNKRVTRLPVEKTWKKADGTVDNVTNSTVREVAFTLHYQTKQVADASGNAVTGEPTPNTPVAYTGADVTNKTVTVTYNTDDTKSWKGAFEGLPKYLVTEQGKFEYIWTAKETKIVIENGTENGIILDTDEEIAEYYQATGNLTTTEGKVIVDNRKQPTEHTVSKTWNLNGVELPTVQYKKLNVTYVLHQSINTGSDYVETSFRDEKTVSFTDLTAVDSGCTWENLEKWGTATIDEHSYTGAFKYWATETKVELEYTKDGQTVKANITDLFEASNTGDNATVAEGVQTITNTQKVKKAKVVKVWKKWDVSKNDYETVNTGVAVEFKLIQTYNGAPHEYGTITLDGTTDDSETTAWQYQWPNLPAYVVDGSNVYDATYSVEEVVSADAAFTQYSMTNAPDATDTQLTVFTAVNRYTGFEVEKHWVSPDGTNALKDGVSITLRLNRVKYASNGEMVVGSENEVDTVTFTYSESDNTVTRKQGTDGDVVVQANGPDAWKFSWDMLPVSVTENETTYTYKYVVKEDALDGYNTAYAVNGQTGAIPAIGGGEVVTNTKFSTVSLPATGGVGTGVIYGAGAALMLLAVLGLILINRKRTDGEGIR